MRARGTHGQPASSLLGIRILSVPYPSPFSTPMFGGKKSNTVRNIAMSTVKVIYVEKNMPMLYVSDIIPFNIDTGSVWEFYQNCIIHAKIRLYDSR